MISLLSKAPSPCLKCLKASIIVVVALNYLMSGFVIIKVDSNLQRKITLFFFSKHTVLVTYMWILPGKPEDSL